MKTIIPMLVVLSGFAAQAADKCGGVKLEGGPGAARQAAHRGVGEDARRPGLFDRRRQRTRAASLGARTHGRRALFRTLIVRMERASRRRRRSRRRSLKPVFRRRACSGWRRRLSVVMNSALRCALSSVLRKMLSRASRRPVVQRSWGADESSLKPAEAGMPVLVNELVKTGPNSKVTIHLKDGSGVEVKAESLIKMSVLQFDAPGERQVKIDVLSGGVTADVRKATQKSRFEASSRVAVASVRGTMFRFGVEENGGSRLETLEGVVAVSSATDPNAKPVEVPAGKGTTVSSAGVAGRLRVRCLKRRK